MAQPYKIINLRKRLRQNGYKEISIERQDERLYKIVATSPLSHCREVRVVTEAEAETILRKHRPVHMQS